MNHFMHANMKTDNVTRKAQEPLIRGINKVADAVAVTMGTRGSNAIIEALEMPGYLVTNDGYTIANSIVLADPQEDMGRKILLEAINRANKASGDGSSTTCVLTSAIIREAIEAGATTQPMALKRELEECIPLIESLLKKESIQIVDDKGAIDYDMLYNVAMVSAEDETIGKRIADIYSLIGPTGVVQWDISKTSEDVHTIGTGITIEGATYVSPYMCDITDAGQGTNYVRIKKPAILVTKQRVTRVDLDSIAQALHNRGDRDIVVFAEDFDPLMVPDVIKTRMAANFRVVIVKMPVIWRDMWYEDIAKATGATVIDPAAGIRLQDANLTHLGTVERISINREDTHLDGIADITAHIQALKDEGTDDAINRAARLNTKSARYYVGAHTESALSHRRLKVEDAIAAAYHALNGGVVVGGGCALRNITAALPDTVGGTVLKTALRAPLYTIMENAGANENTVNLVAAENGNLGYNTRTREVDDLIKSGVTDPYQITFNAVKNAISVAATVLTAPTLITVPREEQTPTNLPVVR